jgi:hypothetical protein
VVVGRILLNLKLEIPFWGGRGSGQCVTLYRNIHFTMTWSLNSHQLVYKRTVSLLFIYTSINGENAFWRKIMWKTSESVTATKRQVRH